MYQRPPPAPQLALPLLPVACSMDDGKHDDFPLIVENLVDNDVWKLDEFARAFDKTRTSHMRERIELEPVLSAVERAKSRPPQREDCL